MAGEEPSAPLFRVSFFVDISSMPASNDKSLLEIVELLLLNLLIIFPSSSECAARFCFEISPRVLVVCVPTQKNFHKSPLDIVVVLHINKTIHFDHQKVGYRIRQLEGIDMLFERL